MIDIQHETLIRLQDVREYLPSSRKGKKLSKAVCFRWAAKGVRGVRLETLHVGAGRMTSLEALQRFADARGEASAPTAQQDTAQSRTRARKAADELTKRGV